jgi:hypothetical protein
MNQWYDETGYDYYSSDVDPQFTDAAAFNFIPTSQAIDNSALYVGIDKDISGAARNLVNPDPGCYEYTSPPCTTPINLGKMQIDPDRSAWVKK